MAHARLRPDQRPGNERHDRDQHHERHEPPRHAIGDGLYWRAAALRFRDHPDDARQHRVGADRASFHNQASRAVDGSPGDDRLDFLEDGRGLPGEHGFIDRGPTLTDHAVNRDGFTRANPQPVPYTHVGKADFLLRTVRPKPARRFRGKVHKGADRATRRRSGPQFEHLAEQHERHHDAGRLIIDRHNAPMRAEGRGEDARRDRRDQAVEEGSADTERDQREHIEVAGAKRGPPPFKKRPPGPQYDRRGKRELDPRRRGRADKMHAEHFREHRNDQQRNGERARHPQPAREINQLRVWSVIERGFFGFERHAADRARPRPFPANLRVHRARPHCAGRRHRFRFRLVPEVCVRAGDELGPASRATEMVGMAGVFGMVRRLFGIDSHPAYRVDYRRCAAFCAAGMGMRVVHGVRLLGPESI